MLFFFFVVQRSTFTITETDDTVFNIIKFTLELYELGGAAGEGNVGIGTIGRRVILVDGSRGIIFPTTSPPDNVYCHCYEKWNKTKTILK